MINTVRKKALNPIDQHVGKRVRMRRMMLARSQTNLGNALGLTFQLFEDAPSVPGTPQAAEMVPSPAYVTELLATSDGLALTKAFMRIKNTKLKHRIVELVEEIAVDDNH